MLDAGKVGALIAVGSRSDVHAFGRSAVIKIPRPTTPDQWIHAEATFTAAVAAVGAPVPELLQVGQLNGRTVSIYQRIDGPNMWQQIRTNPSQAAAMGGLLADLHRTMIDLPPPLALPRQRDRLAHKIRIAARRGDRTLFGLIDALDTGSGPPRLCHGDLHPANVILGAGGPVVVDWFDACLGDPVGDVARSVLLLDTGESGDHTLAHLEGASIEPVGAVRDAYLQAIRTALGITDEALQHWMPIQAAARRAELSNDDPR